MMRQAVVALARLLLLAVPAWLLLRVVLVMLRKRLDPRREILWALTISYACVLIAVTIYPLRSRRMTSPPRDVNTTAFASIKCLERTSGSIASVRQQCEQNVFGNVALFLPFGMLLPLLYRRRSIVSVLLAALIASASIELIQHGERRFGIARTSDVDDVILNVSGALIGFLLVLPFRRRHQGESGKPATLT